MKVFEILNENETFDDYVKEIEAVIGGKLTRREEDEANFEWEQGTEPEDIGTWILRDRQDAADDNHEDEYGEGPNGPIDSDEHSEDMMMHGDSGEPGMDDTEYSMRQGEMGFPDRQR